MYQTVSDGLRPPEKNPVIALGFFDGLHCGHRAILSAARELGKELGKGAVMMTFDPHPSLVIPGQKKVKRIYSSSTRNSLLQELGTVEGVITIRFDENLMQMSPEIFVGKLLSEEYHASGVVVGEDFRFGYRNRGTTQHLQELCARYNIRCRCVAEEKYQEQKISSSRIRVALQNGDLSLANAMLGAPYRMRGKVDHGQGIGSSRLLPTANVALEEDFVTLPDGVYVTRTQVDGKQFWSITNIGCNPTLENEQIRRRSETFLLDVQENLYDRELKIEFLDRIRDERHFDSLEALHVQQMSDLNYVRAYALDFASRIKQ